MNAPGESFVPLRAAPEWMCCRLYVDGILFVFLLTHMRALTRAIQCDNIDDNKNMLFGRNAKKKYRQTTTLDLILKRKVIRLNEEEGGEKLIIIIFSDDTNSDNA